MKKENIEVEVETMKEKKKKRKLKTINIKILKFWTIQSIVSPAYKNFIINLLK